MELKEVILSTIEEIGKEVEKVEPAMAAKEPEAVNDTYVGDECGLPDVEEKPRNDALMQKEDDTGSVEARFLEEQREFLERMRERVLVLFEGFQSPNNKRVEAKIDLTLNFLEYLLASLEERIDSLKK
ncbi:CiaD-like domain-containing protein [Hydrogenimonas sp.]